MQTNLSATSPLSAALGSALPPAVVGSAVVKAQQDMPRFGPTLGQCLTDLKKAADEYKGHVDGAFIAGIRVGNAALTAQDLLPYGEFGKWVETNITAITPQWVRACMRAAEVLGYLEGHPQRDTVLETHRGLQNLAGLLVPIEDLKAKAKPGEVLKLDSIIATPPPKAKPKAKLKIDRSPDAGKDEDEDTTDADAVALHSREQGLDARERKLDAREKDLNAREAKLDERERNVAMREARVNTEPAADATPRKPSSMALQPEGETIDQIKARVAEKAAKDAIKKAAVGKPADKPVKKAAKKAPASPNAAAGSAQTAPVDTKVAPAEKTAPAHAAPTGGATPQPGDEEVM